MSNSHATLPPAHLARRPKTVAVGDGDFDLDAGPTNLERARGACPHVRRDDAAAALDRALRGVAVGLRADDDDK